MLDLYLVWRYFVQLVSNSVLNITMKSFFCEIVLLVQFCFVLSQFEGTYFSKSFHYIHRLGRYHFIVILIAEPVDDKIVGGYNVFRGQYPWVLGIWEKTHGQYFTPRHLRRPFCGGSLITDRFVLTAAHCVYQKDIAR